MKQIFDGEKKKRKRKNSPLALKNFQSMPNVDMYTPKKKKKKKATVQQIIPFFPLLICGIIEGEDISLLVKEEGEGGKRIG